jgi:two-component system, NarL family, nitrate/nitrite response regulator NarL
MALDCGPIVIVDDDDAFREFVSSLLVRTGYRTVEAANGDDVLAEVRREPPALVLLDVNLPGVSGYELCRQLRDEFGEQLPIVFVSAERTDSVDWAAGLLIGADDYIVKPFDPDEFVARVRRFLTRADALARSSRDASADRAVLPLTPREREVLQLLAEGHDAAAIAGELYVSPKTVATHIQHILAKLGVHSRAQAVALAHRAGAYEPAKALGNGARR